jgi:tetratricopeptide (TPR) repeat protein
MKSLIKMLVISCLSFSIKAQPDRYQAAMQNGIKQMSMAMMSQKVEDLQASANQFERIATAEAKEWLPNYYAALATCQIVFTDQKNMKSTDKDAFLDKAEGLLKKAETLSPNNDEIETLKAYIAQGRLAIDPMTRWQTAIPAQQRALETAKTINPNNPRIGLIEGTGIFYTPEQFGGGPKVACPILQESLQKYATFKPASAIHPTWGREFVQMLSKDCK